MKEDIVNPKRYTQNKLQCWDFWIKAGLDPLIASAVKYVWRYEYKNGVEDLKKAKVFLEKAIEEAHKGELYSSYKNYVILPSDVEDLSDKQYRFMLLASNTTGKAHYIPLCSYMIELVDSMIEEMEENK